SARLFLHPHDQFSILISYFLFLSSLLRRPNPRDLPAMLAKRELLQQIGHVLAERGESHLHSPIRTDRCDATGEAQRLGDAVADKDLKDSLTAQLREWSSGLPHAAERVEANRGSTRPRPAGDQQRADHVEQQVDLLVQPQDVRSVRRALVGLLGLPVLVERGQRLQDAQIAVGVAADEGRVERLHLLPGDGEHVFVGELFVENDCVESFVHGQTPLPSMSMTVATASGVSTDCPAEAGPTGPVPRAVELADWAIWAT